MNVAWASNDSWLAPYAGHADGAIHLVWADGDDPMLTKKRVFIILLFSFSLAHCTFSLYCFFLLSLYHFVSFSSLSLSSLCFFLLSVSPSLCLSVSLVLSLLQLISMFLDLENGNSITQPFIHYMRVKAFSLEPLEVKQCKLKCVCLFANSIHS